MADNSLQRLVWKNRTIKHPSAFAGDQGILSRARDAHLDAMIRHGGAGKPCDGRSIITVGKDNAEIKIYTLRLAASNESFFCSP